VELLRRCDSEGLEFRLFETFRSPQRQAWLYQHGRGLPGTKTVTRARPWFSYHQYGLAADFVLFLEGEWNWSTAGRSGVRWKRLHELAVGLNLEPLNFELPHLQLAGLRIADLRAGKFPAGGDELWRENLEAAAASWAGPPPAPPMACLRPPLMASRQRRLSG
jgi:peptidoglycan L-alanyl-D-glutamate endopeptidase CwlK